MSRALALFVLAGCNEFYGLDKTAVFTDAYVHDAPGCAGVAFTGPVKLSDLSAQTEVELQIRHDLREIWFVLNLGPATLFSAKRETPAIAFDPETAAPFGGSDDNFAPALTGDGLRILFISRRSGGQTLWETSRASIEDDFPTTATELAGLSGIIMESVDVSFDGKTIYFTDLLHDMNTYQATRPAFDRPFGPAQMIAAPVSSPSVSPDGLEMFYNPRDGSDRLFRQTRGAITIPFGDPVLIRDSGDNPDLASNGSTMVVGISSGASVLERECR